MVPHSLFLMKMPLNTNLPANQLRKESSEDHGRYTFVVGAQTE